MLSEFFDLSRIKLDLGSRTRDAVLTELVKIITGSCKGYNEQQLLDAVTQREGKMDTIIGPGIAMPHGYCSAVHGIIGAIGFSKTGIEYVRHEENPVHLFFLLLMDESSWERNLNVFSRLMELLKSTNIAEISSMENSRELFDLVRRF